MDKMILMFPAAGNGASAIDEFVEEYTAAQALPFFDTVLFDLQLAIRAGELHLYQQPDYARAPAMYRGPRLSTKQYANLVSAAHDAGIRMTTEKWGYEYLHQFRFADFHIRGETHRDIPETRGVSRMSWYTGYRNMTRTLANNNGGNTEYQQVENSRGTNMVVKDLNATPRFLETLSELTKEKFDELRRTHLEADEGIFDTNLIIQEFIDCKKYGNATNEWRGRFFDGQLFELLPNSNQPQNAPAPPDWLIAAHLDESPYYTLDFVEVYDGDWLILGSDDGQVAKRALGQSAESFYASLEKIARESPHLPEWIWCLVANISDSLVTKKPDGTTIRGTKHFSPGTKIYIGSEWHGGWDDWTFVVMGKPRHQQRLIQIFMKSDRLTNFRLKKVYDKRVIECMTRDQRGGLRLGASPAAHGGWDNSDESKREIEEWVEILNRAAAERERGALPGEGSS